MNSNGDQASHGFPAARLPDLGFVVSWIGRDPATGGYLFGSDDGQIRPVSGGFLPTGPAWTACPSGEAINGIAVLGRTVAVSTGSEVYVHHLGSPDDPTKIAPIFDGGAHGIIATHSGTFVAPIGTDGLLGITSAQEPAPSTWTTRIEGKEPYLLEVAQLGMDGGNDVLAVAARRHGLAILTLSPDRRAGGLEFARSSSVVGFDAVSACSMGSLDSPYAAAALGTDLSVLIWRDARDDRPDEFQIGTLRASGYSISHARGHLFVHTSKGVLVLVDVASRYLAGDDDLQKTETRFIPWEASDLILIDDVGFAMLEQGVRTFLVADAVAGPHRSSDQPEITVGSLENDETSGFNVPLTPISNNRSAFSTNLQLATTPC